MINGVAVIFQLAGSIVLAIGIWLAVDKTSFIGLMKAVPNEHLQVSVAFIIFTCTYSSSFRSLVVLFNYEVERCSLNVRKSFTREDRKSLT